MSYKSKIKDALESIESKNNHLKKVHELSDTDKEVVSALSKEFEDAVHKFDALDDAGKQAHVQDLSQLQESLKEFLSHVDRFRQNTESKKEKARQSKGAHKAYRVAQQ